MQLMINKLYRQPKSYLDKINRFGGYLEYKRMGKANMDMKRASENLPPVSSFADGLPVYFLTGEHFLYQTLFCIASLTKATPQKFRFIIVDDGTCTSPLNLPAPGRRQTLYVILRFRRALCFC